jgi:hypothetical protein
MIVRWRGEVVAANLRPGRFEAVWQGLSLLLRLDAQRRLWRLEVGGVQVRQSWATPRAAMEAVESTLLRLIVKNATVTALQRPGSEAHVTHHKVVSA